MLFDAPLRPDERQLRQFAWALVAFVTMAVSVRWIRHGSVTTAGFVAAAAGWTVGVLGAVVPRRIEPLFVLATHVTRPIGRVVSELLLVLLYFGLITPMAVVSRLVKRDRLRRRLERDAPSYWVPHRPPADLSRYFRQS